MPPRNPVSDEDNFDDMTLFDVSADDAADTTLYTSHQHNNSDDSYGQMSFADDYGKL
jgi:hypothetical protein